MQSASGKGWIAASALVTASGCAVLSGLDAFVVDDDAGDRAGGAGSGGEAGSGVSGGSSAGEGGSSSIVCGDGRVEGAEACDDGNTTPNDGCTSCGIDDGFLCQGQPSVCELSTRIVVTEGPGLGISIPDDSRYDGSVASMECVTLPVAAGIGARVGKVELVIGIQHPFVGDLVIKVVSPTGTVLTVLSRPGVSDPGDTSFGSNGDSSNLEAAHPVRFADGEERSAETMGNSIGGGSVVCKDDNRCDYAPAPERGPGTSFADFFLEPVAGDWLACVADGDSNDFGFIDAVSLSVWTG
ncbi:uncharacterized protein CMC5_028360 [Chondromyces crocatus]|uniref:P/Homo B domain-containing protein n=2 Tax=Chondromyces crocatus TaxID=52 RepID=A0A0K1EDP5_CHOCO|nr:uncharacterized protein CMC5_028360 [Chondromyces crocatus]